MPYPNEHALRVHDPRAFSRGSFRRIQRRVRSGPNAGKTRVLIIGKRPNARHTEVQAVRYPTRQWSETAAKRDAKNFPGAIRFEPAKKTSKAKASRR